MFSVHELRFWHIKCAPAEVGFSVMSSHNAALPARHLALQGFTQPLDKQAACIDGLSQKLRFTGIVVILVDLRNNSVSSANICWVVTPTAGVHPKVTLKQSTFRSR
jgi:hypothetical protein